MKQEKTFIDIPLLEGLSDPVRESFMNMTRTKSWTRGELIISEGDVCKSLFIVTKGVAAVQKYTPSGEYSTIRLLEAGCCFGEAHLFEEQPRYTYTLEAVTDVTILTISMEQFRDLMETDPKIRENYLRVLFQGMKAQDQRITLLSLKTVRQKIAYYLLSLPDPEKDGKVSLPVAKEVVAKYLSIPRPSFSRELTLMEKEGSIKVSGRSIDLLDIPAIRKELGDL